MIERTIRGKAMTAFAGKTPLSEYIGRLAASDWWFRDYIQAQPAQRIPRSDLSTESAHASDLVQAWAILAGSGSAWSAFLDTFNSYVETTAVKWCHRANASGVCSQCKPGADTGGCDRFSDAYLYILTRLRYTALAVFEGRSALRSFVFLCLHDWRWWASFVQQEKGKVKLPNVLKDEPQTVQKIYFRIVWGWNNELIANALNLPLQAVEDMRQAIAEKLQAVGRTLGPRNVKTISLTSLLAGREAEDESAPVEPRAPEISPELRAEANSYFASLSPLDRSILRLKGEGRNAKEMAIALDVPEFQIYSKLAKIRKGMPEWFKNSKDRREKGRAVPSNSTEGDEE